MNVSEINPTTRPDLFFLGRDPGDGSVIYDVPFEEVTEATGKSVRKRVANGRVQKQHLDMDGTVYIYADDVLVASWIIQPQYYQGNQWRDFSRAWQYVDYNSDSGAITGSGTQGGFSWDINLAIDGKWSVNLTAPGVLMRAIWEITVYDPTDLEIRVDDYLGNFTDDEGSPVRTIILEPDGVQDSWVIDPYLSLNTQATYYEVAGVGGFSYRIYTDTTNYDLILQGGAEISRGYFGRIYSSSTAYNMQSDPLYSVTLVENNALRAKFSCVGHPYNSGYLDATNFDNIHREVYAYASGLIYVKMNYKATNNTTIDDDLQNYIWSVAEQTADTWTQFGGYYDSEYDSNWQETPATDYYNGLRSTGNYGISCHLISVPGGFVVAGQTLNAQLVRMRIDDTQIDAGDNVICMAMLLDDNLTLAASDRYGFQASCQDQSMTDPDPGDAVTDLVTPLSIGSSGFASDGAWHTDVDSTNYDAKLTWDATRTKPNVVLHRFPAITGASPGTVHNINYLPCEDAAASSVVTALIGTNAVWRNYSDDSARNTVGDSVAAIRGNGLDTDGGAAYIDLDLTSHANSFLVRGTLIITVIPNFAYNVSTHQQLFNIRYDSNNIIRAYYIASTDSMRFDTIWGGTPTSINLQDFTASNPCLGVPMAFRFVWDADYDFMQVFLDNRDTTIGLNAGTPTGNDPVTATIINTTIGSTPGDYIIDSVSTLNRAILPYGTFIHGNVESDYSDAHATVLFYWLGNDVTGDNVEIGGIQGTLDDNNTGSTTSFPTTGGPGGSGFFDNESGTANYDLTFSMTATQIDFNNGTIAFWLCINTVADGDAVFGIGDADDYIQCAMDASGNLDVTYRSQSTSETITGNIALTAGTWHYVRITFDDNGVADNMVHCYIDGIENGTAQTIANTWGGGTTGTLYIGSDYGEGNNADISMAYLTITNSPSTPQLPFALGAGPLWIPKTKVGT